MWLTILLPGSKVKDPTLKVSADHTCSLAKGPSDQKDELRGESRRKVIPQGHTGKKWGTYILRPVSENFQDLRGYKKKAKS